MAGESALTYLELVKSVLFLFDCTFDSVLFLFALDVFSFDVSLVLIVSCYKLWSVSFRQGTIRYIRGNTRFLKFEISVSIPHLFGKCPSSALYFFDLDISLFARVSVRLVRFWLHLVRFTLL